DDHHLVVVDFEQCTVDELGHIRLVSGSEETESFLGALRGPHEAVARRILAKLAEDELHPVGDRAVVRLRRHHFHIRHCSGFHVLSFLTRDDSKLLRAVSRIRTPTSSTWLSRNAAAHWSRRRCSATIARFSVVGTSVLKSSRSLRF